MNDYPQELALKIFGRLDQLEDRISGLENTLLRTKKRRMLLRNKGSPLGAILKLHGERFFETPREFPEVRQELVRQGYYYQRAHLYTALTRGLMQRRGLLTRIGKQGEWKYVERK